VAPPVRISAIGALRCTGGHGGTARTDFGDRDLGDAQIQV
jgi:hypothetical protein